MGRPKAEEKGKKGKRKTKKIKDKNAPKKPCTPFFYFVKHRRNLKEDQGKRVSDFTKECGLLWGKLTATDKNKFDELSKTDRTRYEKEMAIYKPSTVNPDEPPKPKRPPTPFLLYVNSVREKLRNEGLNQKEILVRAGQLWKALTPDEKQPHTDAGEVEKKKYQKEMEKYNELVKNASSKKTKQNNGAVAQPRAPAPKNDVSDEEDDEEDEPEDEDEEDDDVESDDE